MKSILATSSSAAIFWASLAMTLGDLIFVGIVAVMLFFVLAAVKFGLVLLCEIRKESSKTSKSSE